MLFFSSCCWFRWRSMKSFETVSFTVGFFPSLSRNRVTVWVCSAQLSHPNANCRDGCWNFSTCYVVGLMLREPPPLGVMWKWRLFRVKSLRSAAVIGCTSCRFSESCKHWHCLQAWPLLRSKKFSISARIRLEALTQMVQFEHDSIRHEIGQEFDRGR